MSSPTIASDDAAVQRAERAQQLYGLLGIAALVAVALALRLRLAWESLDKIIYKSTPDDAYYYFQIARNIAHGHNVTFDGETVTNGFHPLWLALITPVYWFASGDTLPVHIILTFGAILGAGTVALIYLTLMRLGCGVPASLVGASFYAVHPQAVADAANGVESALVVFAFTMVVWLFVRLVDKGSQVTTRDIAVFGVACGLMVLARTDTLFVVPPVLLFLLWKSATEARVRRASIFAGAMFLTLLPWLLWSIIATGTILQISGLASGWFARTAYTNVYGDALGTHVKHSFWLVRTTLFDVLMHKYFVPHSASATPYVIAAVGIATTFCFLLPGAAREAFRRQLLLVALPASGIVAALVFHAGYRWQIREWYFALAASAGAMLLGVFVHAVQATLVELSQRRAGQKPASATAIRWATGLVVAVAILLVVQPQRATRWVYYTHVQTNHLATARWLEANTDADARVGSFNAGIIGYFSDRTVVNLDGVVNADAYKALKHCNTPLYIRERNLQYVADLPSALTLASCGDRGGTYTVVATIGEPIPWPDRGLLQVVRVNYDGPAATAATP